MTTPTVATREEWLAARLRLLQAEKELTHQRDALTAIRRAMPMVRVDKPYTFEGPSGPATLGDLFGPHPQLLVYHFMFDPRADEGCRSCSYFADNVAGAVQHLAARNTSFVAVSRAAIAKIQTFKRRMGWTFPWVSSSTSDFNYDFRVTVDRSRNMEHNYQSAQALFDRGELWALEGELPGLSVFYRHGSEIYHSYSTYQRGLDPFLNTYTLLDLTPLGRQEDDGRIMQWIRHHDRYAA